jgi:hypothetical protein
MAESGTTSPPRRRGRRATAALAAAAYLGAAGAAVAIVRSSVDAGPQEGVAGAAVERRAAPVSPSSTRTAEDRLATQVRAARAQRSVFRLEAANGAAGSAFVAWQADGRSYLVTARSLVALPLAEGERRVFLRRGDRVWDGRVWGVHGDSGLAVVWVRGALAPPLWQQPRRSERLAQDEPAVVVAGGPGAALGDGVATSVSGTVATVAAPVDELALGAPVVAASGRIAGVVVSAATGRHRVVAMERACARLRDCS